ncbi:MAG: patatin-like phospholipase family protein [Gordonia sp. (in: high G+C Gram-positive bacteria)]|uniref:patatin-like phospholipase family protein n=1 Tax=Gordonia sp. (in: high G+C Gram-positive bacteria) TaxID=84139 RepID=UPI0039E2229B
MSRIALALGCGGTVGGAWSMAALHSLAQALDWDPREAAIIQGTSAGAEIATMLGAGFSTQDLVDMQRGEPVDARLAAHLANTPPSFPPIPGLAMPNPRTLLRRGGHRPLVGLAPAGRGDASWLDRLAGAVCPPGKRWLDRPGIRLVGYRTDDDTRIAFTGPSEADPANPALSSAATLSQAMRASWGIPGWMPSVSVDGRDHCDGGAASTASVDLIGADEADVVYVIASMAGLDDVRGPGVGGLAEYTLLRRPMSAVLRREVAEVRRRGTEVVVVSPTADELGALGANFMDAGRRAAAFESSLVSTRATVAAALSTESPR